MLSSHLKVVRWWIWKSLASTFGFRQRMTHSHKTCGIFRSSFHFQTCCCLHVLLPLVRLKHLPSLTSAFSQGIAGKNATKMDTPRMCPCVVSFRFSLATDESCLIYQHGSSLAHTYCSCVLSQNAVVFALTSSSKLWKSDRQLAIRMEYFGILW